MEEWRPVVGYEGLYEVSDLGRVRSLDRIVNYRDGRRFTYKGVSLVLSDNGYGYAVVTLSKGKDSKKVRLVHSLVLESFEGPRPPKLDICHRDNDKRNNRLENLRYDTRVGNLADSDWKAETCRRGHPLAERNLLKSQRRCLACSRASNMAGYWGRAVTQELTDAYYREIMNVPEAGDEETMGRKFRRRKNV